MSILCKIFGHKLTDLCAKRATAMCDRCWKLLKVSYDMAYGETVVIGDYGNQRTFVWCDCGNELCSSNSFVSDTKEYGVEYKCTECGLVSNYDFDSPIPYRIKDKII